MKFINVKNKIKSCVVIAASLLTLLSSLKAEEVVLPTVSKPDSLQEGIQRTFTDAQIAELLPWAQNSKLFLTDALESLQGLSAATKVERLVSIINQTVEDSNKKNSEIFMRYVLNRSLVINEILAKEMDTDKVGTLDAQLRVLVSSVKMSLKYYDIDLSVLNKKKEAPFKDFGVEYFNFLTELNKSIFDASAQYSIQRTALEFLQWDLYRDLNNKSYAAQILKINNNLKFFPTTKISDAQAIAYIRQMKKVTIEMEFISRGLVSKTENVPTETDDTYEKLDTTLQAGDSVIDSSGYPAKITAILTNGILILETSSGSKQQRQTNEIGYVKGCAKKLCVGEKVIDKSGYPVTITGIKSDSSVFVYQSGWSYSETRNANEIAKITGCNKDNFCVGENVIDSTGYIVKITGVKDNNELFVFKAGWHYSEIRRGEVLARVKGCAESNICVGDKVYIDNNLQEAKVTGIINEKSVRIFVSGWSYSEIRSTSSLGIIAK